MLQALVFGLVASSAFVFGVLLGLTTNPPRRVVASVVAFGAGILVCALSFELMAEAFAEGTVAWSIGGFMLGALIYVVIDVMLEKAAAASPKRTGRDPRDVVPHAEAVPETEEQATAAGLALLVGTALDGIPENAAIGIGLAAEKGEPGGPGVGLVLMGAVFLSNLPAAISSAAAMRQEGRSLAYILGVWGAVAVACVVATVAGYALLAGLPGYLTGALLALAAGSILAMLADTMIPEAFRDGGPWVAMATASGFACAFLLSQWTSG